MAKHCINCGRELRGDERFCAHCGAPVSGKAAVPESQQWEYCEIEFDALDEKGKWRIIYFDSYWVMRFWAKAIGPQGEYRAEQSDIFEQEEIGFPMRPYQAEESTKPLNALVAKLTSSGWELLPNKGPAWYSYKFRRSVKG